MKRIAITGPESCGKTMLTEALANHFSVSWVPEYSRSYLTKLNRPYVQEDLDQIALGQQNAVEESDNSNYLIVDTEMLVMKIWSQYKYSQTSSLIQQLLKNQQFDLYILCAPDIPFEQDELRENPQDRDVLFELYREELDVLNVHYIVADGSHVERLKHAIEEINLL